MHTLTRSLAGAAGLGLVLTGCTTNAPAPTGSSSVNAGTLLVSSTADACTVSSATTTSGTATFEITNEGTQTTEFYLLGADGLRIVAERENIAPGSSAQLTVNLQPGDYFTACKPGMRGANVGEAAFTVTGDPVELSGEDQELFDAVVVDYVNFVKNEVAELQPEVAALTEAYIAGDDEQARTLFAPTRVHYERIEPVAEALGVLDPRIDYREIDYKAEADQLVADDPTFTEWLGFHRIEKDLWVPAEDAVQPDGSSAWDDWSVSSQADRQRIGETLQADIATLYATVHSETFIADQQIDVATVSNGAAALLEEVAVTKVTGEEDWWSHTDLYDFAANVEGARVAFDLVAPIAERKGADGVELVDQISTEFDDLEGALASYGSMTDGFVGYDTVDRAGQRDLVTQIDAAREPLSKLTGTVLGIG
ncbi:MAG: iron uptake system protein EfeO [Propioniciclava sp.]